MLHENVIHLKNAGATYECMVDKVFKDQIGRNVEVYVDDMVIKSKGEETFISDINETFCKLREVKVKLNLAKCTYGLEGRGSFWGT